MVWRCREGRTIWYGGVEKGGPYGMEVYRREDHMEV